MILVRFMITSYDMYIFKLLSIALQRVFMYIQNLNCHIRS